MGLCRIPWAYGVQRELDLRLVAHRGRRVGLSSLEKRWQDAFLRHAITVPGVDTNRNVLCGQQWECFAYLPPWKRVRWRDDGIGAWASASGKGPRGPLSICGEPELLLAH